MLGSPTVERQASRSPELDLRRGYRRELAQRVVDLAHHLPAPDRCLIEGVFRDGRSITELARIWPDGPTPTNLRRRLHRLVERMTSPAFQGVAARLESWDTPRRRVAIACVLHGMSNRQAAASLGMSLYTLRRHLQAILAICEAPPRRRA